MSDLAEFLRARITEDGAMVPSEHAGEDYGTGFNLDSVTVEVGCPRWLAECEAKRAIVELHHAAGRSGLCDECHSKVWPCPTLRLLALPHAGHPDYREEWRPASDGLSTDPTGKSNTADQ